MVLNFISIFVQNDKKTHQYGTYPDSKKDVREFVDNYLLARDSRALREHIKQQQPDVDMSYILDDGEEVEIPLGLTFFWPDF